MGCNACYQSCWRLFEGQIMFYVEHGAIMKKKESALKRHEAKDMKFEKKEKKEVSKLKKDVKAVKKAKKDCY